MLNRFDDITGPGFSLRPNHRRAFINPAELPVRAPQTKGTLNWVLSMITVVRRRQALSSSHWAGSAPRQCVDMHHQMVLSTIRIISDRIRAAPRPIWCSSVTTICLNLLDDLFPLEWSHPPITFLKVSANPLFTVIVPFFVIRTSLPYNIALPRSPPSAPNTAP